MDFIHNNQKYELIMLHLAGSKLYGKKVNKQKRVVKAIDNR